jgi:hypothetical protein
MKWFYIPSYLLLGFEGTNLPVRWRIVCLSPVSWPIVCPSTNSPVSWPIVCPSTNLPVGWPIIVGLALEVGTGSKQEFKSLPAQVSRVLKFQEFWFWVSRYTWHCNTFHVYPKFGGNSSTWPATLPAKEHLLIAPVTAIPFFTHCPPLVIVGETQHCSSIIGAISSNQLLPIFHHRVGDALFSHSF